MQANLWHCVAQVAGEYWVVTPSMMASDPDMWIIQPPGAGPRNHCQMSNVCEHAEGEESQIDNCPHDHSDFILSEGNWLSDAAASFVNHFCKLLMSIELIVLGLVSRNWLASD